MSIDLKSGTDLSVPTDTAVAMGASAAAAVAPGLFTFANVYSYLKTKLLATSADLSSIYSYVRTRLNGSTPTFTITIASPGVVTMTGDVADGDPFIPITTGALPTGLTAGTIYYIKSPTAGTFNLALTPGGAAINTSGTQSGTHSAVIDDGPTFLSGRKYSSTDIASAATTDIGAATVNTLHVRITGTTTITSLGTGRYRRRTVLFAGILTLTHDATVLILPGAANIVTAAGDVADFRADHLGNWRCLSYTKADGTALVGSGGGSSGLPRSYLAGLETSNNAGTPNSKIDVAAGKCRDSTNAFDISSSSVNTIDCTTTGANGLDIGSLGASLGYHAFAISKSDGTFAALASLALGVSGVTVTMTIASPGVVTWANHGLYVGAPVVFSTTGALPTGVTAGTIYYVKTVVDVNSFQIAATQGGSVINTTGSQSGVHTAASNPALPAGYSYFRRVASFKTNGSSNIIAYLQTGDLFDLSVPVQDVSATNPGTSAVLRKLSVPTGIKVEAKFSVADNSTSSNHFGLITSPDQADTTPSITAFSWNAQATAGPTTLYYGGQFRCRTDTSGQIRTRQSASGVSDSITIVTHGWTDTRGRNG